MNDNVPIFLAETPCPVCRGTDVYSIRYRPDKPDSYAVCAECGAFRGDELVTKE